MPGASSSGAFHSRRRQGPSASTFYLGSVMRQKTITYCFYYVSYCQPMAHDDKNRGAKRPMNAFIRLKKALIVGRLLFGFLERCGFSRRRFLHADAFLENAPRPFRAACVMPELKLFGSEARRAAQVPFIFPFDALLCVGGAKINRSPGHALRLRLPEEPERGFGFGRCFGSRFPGSFC